MKIKFVFFGADDFSVIVLEQLKKAGFLPAFVVTAPDRPKGRGLTLSAPPVKLWASAHNVPILQPEELDSSVKSQLSKVTSDVFVVASYGLILPRHILDIPARGTLNVHPSLLPKYRGATPIESQILNDEKEVGVTIMLMDERMDHGPIVAQQHWKNTEHNTQNPNKTQNTDAQKGSKLKKELAEIGGGLLAEVMPKWVAGEMKAVSQDESRATYTKKLTKADGEIDLRGDVYLAEAERRRRAYKNFLKIRAFDGGIGTHYYADSMQTLHGQTQKKKVRVVIKSAEFRDGALHITRVIPEGKREMSYDDFLRGLK